MNKTDVRITKTTLLNLSAINWKAQNTAKKVQPVLSNFKFTARDTPPILGWGGTKPKTNNASPPPNQ